MTKYRYFLLLNLLFLFQSSLFRAQTELPAPRRQMVSALRGLARGSAPAAVRGAALRTLLVAVRGGAELSAAEVASVALTAQERLTDVEAPVAAAARALLTAVAMPAALLAASGLDVGGIQDEPAWRSQVHWLLRGFTY